ncbi:hypothetical protein [Streptococcus dysgalactiae]|uniref:hypothetical protein n=1 Tax=Streptococcus dysgalactiae TaxID=1334 RepID=UPI001CF37512|nr:hypothetical protein [Streptococcus dysgalactiae]MCB2828911.1 hypothetical protein [Streptococcus dysgalactiae subsp. dysgalactiae]MCB2842780.1 hypothetical protein [Streptococcus dysgalactiae subsp. dysgalactiae]MCB2849972.1 hypothetical protein [Streptococcus dysgalactiae subsp. dysgalactiae]
MTALEKQLPKITKTCFVVTAIGQNGSPERIQADKVLKYLIEPVCREFGYKVVRVDKESTNGDINESIINHLKSDELVIADMTGHNANAFYEFGFRQALGLPLIPIIKHTEKLPFDVIARRTVFYDTDVAEIENSKERLRNMVHDVDAFVMPSQRSQSELNLQSIDSKLNEVLNLLKKNNPKTKPATPTKVKTHEDSRKFNENLIANLKINNEGIKLKSVETLQQRLQRIITDQNSSDTINASFLKRESSPQLSLSDKKF